MFCFPKENREQDCVLLASLPLQNDILQVRQLYMRRNSLYCQFKNMQRAFAGCPIFVGKTAFGSGICITISSFWFLASSPFSLLIQSQPPVSPSAFPYNPSWGTGPKGSPLPPVPFLSLLFSFAPFSWLYSISLNSIRSWFGPRMMKNRTPFSQKGSSSMPRLTISYPCSRALS